VGAPARLEHLGDQYRCIATDEGVPVVATLTRDGLHWTRDELYVDGNRVAPEALTSALATAKERRRLAAEEARQRAAAQAFQQRIRDAATAARDRLRTLFK
jgi:hypothetical protein